MTQVLAGPFGTMQLADLGAEVIKIEPLSGASRDMGFPMKGSDSAGFHALNRNKKSVSVDLKDSQGREALLDLVKTADVFVENYRPGVTRKLSIDWARLSAVNPQLIYASISGFGQTGPLSERPGYDLLAQAMSGVMSVTGFPGQPPSKCGIPIGDLSAGLFCAQGILAAIIERGRTNRGQYLEVSLLDSLIALSVWESCEFWSTGNTPAPLGSGHRATAPYQAVRASDGYFAIAVNNQSFWRRFCHAIGRVDLAENECFASNSARMENLERLIAEIEASTRARTVLEWEQTFMRVDVPVSRILNYREALDNGHVRAREMVIDVDHPVEGLVKSLGNPVKYGGEKGDEWSGAPLLGAHTEELLRDAGVDALKISSMIADDAVYVQGVEQQQDDQPRKVKSK